VQVNYFPSKVLRRLYFSPKMRVRLREVMCHIDLLHTHSVFLWPTWAAANEARAQNVPYIVSPRGMLVSDLIERKSSFLKKAWIALIEKKNLLHASGVHVTSSLEAMELARLNIRPERVFEIPNGVDLPDPSASNDRWTGSGAERQLPTLPGEYVLFLGRINWKKGLDRLVAAMRFAPSQQLVMAGVDDEQYWNSLQEKATLSGVAKQITYVGPVWGQSKQRLLSGASILVLPSYSENFGNVVLEAMACGVPVIVTPEVGVAGIVEATQSGLVVEGQPEKLGKEIDRLMQDRSRRATMGENGKVVAATQFSWDAVAEKMERAYLEAIG
jgi:glycosyltransferase involved in cell wall biosynthesis